MSAFHQILSAATITAVGLTCKAFLSLGFCSSVSVTGLHHLICALESSERRLGQGVVTVSNHLSVLDDPLAWGILPTRHYLSPHNMRWALGASDICFTNPLFSTFFNHGQVWETIRGNGIYQASLDNAIEKLNEGGWVHLFGEGKVNQPDTYPVIRETSSSPDKEGRTIMRARLPRFKWGTGRVIMETHYLPVVIPMWLSGFDQVMPENRTFPRFLPRLGKDIRITFGVPIDPSQISSILDPWREKVLEELPVPNCENSKSDSYQIAVLKRTKIGPSDYVPLGSESLEKRDTRIALTALIQRHVEELGYSIEGPMLGLRQD